MNPALLADQRGCVHQEGDGHLVAPGDGPVVEHVVEAAAAGEQVLQHLGAGLDAQVGGHHVQQVPVADLVLGLGQDRHLVAQPGGLGNPVPLGQTPHQLAVGVHLDEGEHRSAVGVGHVVVGLHQAADVEEGLEVLHGRPGPSHRRRPRARR